MSAKRIGVAAVMKSISCGSISVAAGVAAACGGWLACHKASWRRREK